MNSRFTVLNPCPRKWADLQGDGPARYCDVCRTDVYAVNEYSSEEREQLWRESNGHMCGLVVGKAIEVPRSRRAVLVGALLTAVSPLMAQNGKVEIRVTDASGKTIPEPSADLREANSDKVTRRFHGNAQGEILVTDLPLGDNRLSVEAPGFGWKPLTVTIRNSDEVRVDIVLERIFIGILGH